MTTLLQIADAHLRADGEQIYGRDPERNLAVVVAACARELPGADAVVLSGDQSDDAELAALERAKEMIAPLGASVLAIPGNHDGPELQRAVFGARASADVGRWRVVAIDSSIPGEIHGSVDVAAAERLLDALDARPTVLAIHHPPLAPTTHPWFQLEHAQALLASLTARPHVRAVLSGHVHVPFERTHGALRLLGAPSTLAPFSFDDGELTVGGEGVLGARALRLGDDGSFESRLIVV